MVINVALFYLLIEVKEIMLSVSNILLESLSSVDPKQMIVFQNLLIVLLSSI